MMVQWTCEWAGIGATDNPPRAVVQCTATAALLVQTLKNRPNFFRPLSRATSFR
jgi:hypothetical protein